MPNLELLSIVASPFFKYCSKVRLFQNTSLSNLFVSILTICHYYTCCIFPFCSVQDLFNLRHWLKYCASGDTIINCYYYFEIIFIFPFKIQFINFVTYTTTIQSDSHWYNTKAFFFLVYCQYAFWFLMACC